MSDWYRMTAQDDGEASIQIYDAIGGFMGEGVSAKQFSQDLKALGKVKNLNLHINSPGGDVFEAQAIYSQLKTHKAKKTVHIDGLAASAASIVAMAGDEILMPENAMMMIHNPFGLAVGESADMRRVADRLDKVKDTMLSVYARKTGLTPDHISDLLNEETWMTAEEAVDLGFADHLAEPVKIAASFDLSRFKNVPQAFHSLPKPSTKGERTMSQEQPTTTDVQANVPAPAPSVQAEVKTTEPARFTEVVDVKAERQRERERVNKIYAFGYSMGCTQEFLAGLVGQDLEVPDAYEQIAADAKGRQFMAKNAVQSLMNENPNPSAGGPQEPAPQQIDASLPIEERAKKEWEQQPALRAEFATEAEYIAYRRFEAEGRIKVISK